MTYNFVVVGGGIVGLSTAFALTERHPGAGIAVLEKEGRWAAHQSGRNSGVMHSGIYYRPGSRKAELARRGSRALVEFCTEHGIGHEVCGKVIVASTPAELPYLAELHRRALANGLTVTRLTPEGLREIEPHAEGIAALHVPASGIVDFRRVAEALAALIARRGTHLRLNTTAQDIVVTRTGVRVEAERETFKARFLVNCGGLYSDRLARRAGVATPCRIVPFRGEYFEIRPQRRFLVRNLIYPVPNPAFPFLGVHLTRTIAGSVHAGPNAVIAFGREGYSRRHVRIRDLADMLGYVGFWRLARRHWRAATAEASRSLIRRRFVRSLQRLVPSISVRDLVPGRAGVRAQALGPDGRLVDDFLFARGRHSLHVLNAPSPAATASLSIGEAIADRVTKLSSAPSRRVAS